MTTNTNEVHPNDVDYDYDYEEQPDLPGEVADEDETMQMIGDMTAAEWVADEPESDMDGGWFHEPCEECPVHGHFPARLLTCPACPFERYDAC